MTDPLPEAERLGDRVNGHPEHVEDVVPRLLALLTDAQDPRVTEAVVQALGHAWHPAAAAVLLDHVRPDHPDPQVRLALAQALPGGLDTPGDLRGRAVDTLVHLTRDPETPVRDWAAFGLGRLRAGSPAARDALAALITDPDRDTRDEALLALAGVGDERALPVLRRCLEEGGTVSLLELEAATALAAPELHPALDRLAREWADDRDEFTARVATARARCAPTAAAVAHRVEQDVLDRVRHLAPATSRVVLADRYPWTVLSVTEVAAGDLHLPLWEDDEVPGDEFVERLVSTVTEQVRWSLTPRGGSTPPAPPGR